MIAVKEDLRGYITFVYEAVCSSPGCLYSVVVHVVQSGRWQVGEEFMTNTKGLENTIYVQYSVLNLSGLAK